MDPMDVLGAFFSLLLIIGSITLSGFFIYWIARILIIIPKCLLRITAALEKIANK